MKRPITITLTRYAEPNWLLAQTLRSLAAQRDVHARILLLDQQDCASTRALCNDLSTTALHFDYQVIPAKNLSFARNEAIRLTETDILLFIDTDALAREDWALNLSSEMLARDAAISGGRILPKWHGRPGILQRSLIVQEQYSMLDLGSSTRHSRKIVGANFGLNLSLLKQEAYFDEEFGRRPGSLLGGEESELCRRAQVAGHALYYVGSAQVLHQVLPERLTSRWIFRRMYYAGYRRAMAGGAPQPSHDGHSVFHFYDFLALSLLGPAYICGFIKAKWGSPN